MGCDTFEFMGSTGFICGPGINQKPKRCAFCEHRSTKLCDWPVEKQKTVYAHEVKAGDRVIQGKRRLAISLAEVLHDGRIHLEYSADGTCTYAMAFRPDATFHVEVKGTCDKPCCYRHSRHVGPDRDYCQEHWRQENIA